MNKVFWIVPLAFLAAGNINCAGSETGTVSGVIVSSDGGAVAGAKVYALNPSVAAADKILYSLSDGDGAFRIDGVVPGMNMICTTKPEAFYPDTGWGVNSPPGKGAPTVEVRAGQTVSGVRVVIYPGRKINGVVRDAATGAALRARFVMSRAEAPEYYEDDELAADGSFSYVVPTVPMEMRVSAPGYGDWIMVEPRDGRDPAVHTARTVKEIEVKLKRRP